MEIIKFAAWLIKKMSMAERMLTAFLTWLAILIVNLYFFGAVAFVIFVGGVFSVVFSVLFQSLYKNIMKRWQEYKRIKDEEAQRIVDRLRGIDRSKGDWPGPA